MHVHQVPSPNCGPRRDGLTPTLIVLHYTAMSSAKVAIQRLCDPVAEVSAHYVIARAGRITQLVPETMRAWHAGAGEWRGQDDINSRSIGIELDNNGTSPFPELQMQALETLMRDIMQRHNISPDGVIGHSDMAPARKHDPGARFDWQRLERQGLAQGRANAPIPSKVTSEAFRKLAYRHGFTATIDDRSLLNSVRLRFRPWATGPLEPADFACLSA